jgi:hypothetical protein
MNNLTGGQTPASLSLKALGLSLPDHEPGPVMQIAARMRPGLESPLFDKPAGAEPGFLAALDYAELTREEAKAVKDGPVALLKKAVGADSSGKAAVAGFALLSSAPAAYAQWCDPGATGMAKMDATVSAFRDGLAILAAAAPQLAAMSLFQIVRNSATLYGIGRKVYVDAKVPEPTLFGVEYRALKPSA